MNELESKIVRAEELIEEQSHPDSITALRKELAVALAGLAVVFKRGNLEEIALRKSQLASAGAPRLFRNLAIAIEEDLKQYHERGGNSDLQYKYNSDIQFSVKQKRFPAVTLDVKLNETTVEFSHWRCKDDTETGTWKHACFRVVSDLEGSVQLTQGQIAFSNPAAISEALLKPVFDSARRGTL